VPLNEADRLTRANVETYTIQILHVARNWTKADVRLVKVNGCLFVVKDIRRRNLFVRLLFARRLLRREFHVLRQLRDVPGVPQVYHMLDADAFVMEYVEGHRIKKLKQVSDATLQRLHDLFVAIHRRGIAHGDPHKSNILVTAEGAPFLVDFGTALVLKGRGRSWSGGWRERLWQEMQKKDLRSVAKTKQRFTPHLLTEEEKQLLDAPSPFYRMGRALRRVWDVVTFREQRRRWKKQRRRRAKLSHNTKPS
jgi:predicted Ser/Thr protein kinase